MKASLRKMPKTLPEAVIVQGANAVSFELPSFADQGMFRSGDYFQIHEPGELLEPAVERGVGVQYLAHDPSPRTCQRRWQEFTPEDIAHISPLAGIGVPKLLFPPAPPLRPSPPLGDRGPRAPEALLRAPRRRGALPAVGTLPRAVHRSNRWSTGQTRWMASRLRRSGLALIVSLVRLRRGDEQHPAWSLAVIFFERGAEHHLATVIVMRSGVGNDNGGRWDSQLRSYAGGQFVPTPGITVPVRATRWSEPCDHTYNPISGTTSLLFVSVQGCIEDDFSGVVQVDLKADDRASGHKCASSWHRIARACHRNSLSRPSAGIPRLPERQQAGM